MILLNNYFFFKSALTEKQCVDIISAGISSMEMTKHEGRSTNATTFDNKEKAGINKDGKVNKATNALGHLTRQGARKKGATEENTYVRDSKVGWLSEKWIYNLIHPFIHEANKRAGWNFEWDFSEPAQFTKYEPGGFYGWHSDSGPRVYQMAVKKDNVYKVAQKTDIGWIATDKDAPTRKDGTLLQGWVDNPNFANKIRKLSVTVNLTTPGNYEGGNLRFDMGPHQIKRYVTCKEIRPRGSIIIFPSHIYHQVTPVTKGTRYSLVMWNLGYPFK